VRRKYGIPDGPFVLALGNLQPRKNIQRLVEAFAIARRAPDFALSLVIAGKAQWRESQVHAAVAQAGLEDSVVFPGYVDEADLPALYSAAALFAYPSLYEGFGLPPLEAMACGTPVVCSHVASLPEVVGDAAVTVAPTDTEALAQALLDVLTQPGLHASLRARGLRRAAQFSWDRCAAETLAVYREAARAWEAG
jgi:glycosyltransferase involved in cell wall biosynthesis